MFEEALEEAGLGVKLHVISAREDAFDFVRQDDKYEDTPIPDVTLLDWNLPNAEAEDLLHLLKDTYPDIPVIVITGSEPYREILEEEAVRADDYRCKPTDPDEYNELIQHCIELYRQ